MWYGLDQAGNPINQSMVDKEIIDDIYQYIGSGLKTQDKETAE